MYIEDEFSGDLIDLMLFHRNQGGILNFMRCKGITASHREVKTQCYELVDYVKQHAQPYIPRLPLRMQRLRHYYSIDEKRITYMNLKWPNAYAVFQTAADLTELPNS